MAVAAQEKWEEAFEEEEEALSLSGLQVAIDKDDNGECKSSDADEDFEFRISVAGGLLSNAAETDMCAADEVFFQGQILPLRPSISSCRPSWSSSAPPGWGIFRLGIAKAPEIELYDMMSRRSNSCGVSSRKGNAEAKQAKKASRGTRIEANVQKKAPPRPGGRGFSCKCSSDALEPIAIPTKKKKEETMRLKRGETVRRRRVFEWLEDLSIAKATWS
ncbi:hypothetical protein GW17_00043471 [Ensete ventricosum]|nr:hypothetical protein GW17_00043471 [Ensete ventricosum]